MRSCLFVYLLRSYHSVHNRALSAIAQAESLKFKLMGGLAVRRACYGVLRYIMDNGAKGCELVISGKMGQQRAKAMKFRAGYMIKSGDGVNHYVDYATRHIQLKQVSTRTITQMHAYQTIERVMETRLYYLGWA